MGGDNRRRRGTIQESSRNKFLREVPQYGGTDEDFQKAHYQHYGREEKLRPDGKHHHGSNHFPHGTDREKMHTQYTKSTKPRDDARSSYQKGLLAAERELGRMSFEEREYYLSNTGGLAPHHHERLDPRAKKLKDVALENADKRRAMLEAHPHGYHTAEEQNRHHRHAKNAYGEHDYASRQQEHHERYRSYSNVDPRRDQWGRPVTYH